MRFSLHYCLLALLCCGLAQPARAQRTPDQQYLRQHYRKLEVMVPMRDGVKLFTQFYIPKDASASKTYPFLMQRTPYSCLPYGSDTFNFGRKDRPNYFRLAKEGFILVTQDVRGRWASEGKYEHVRPLVHNLDKKTQKETDEATDTYDSIEWMLKNIAGNNGRVGIYGVSYPGFYATTAAVSGHPALRAVSPQAPVTDWFIGDDVHHGGAFFWMDFFSFLPSFARDNPKLGDRWRDVATETDDNYEFYLKHVVNARIANERYLKDTIAFWKDIMAHPNYDAYWQSRNPLPHAKQVKPAMLVVGGWYDAEDTWGALETYQKLEQQNPNTANQLVMGPWCHGCWWSEQQAKGLGDVDFGSHTGNYYIDSLFLPFMNHHLKDKGPAPKLAEATVFETGANRWHKMPSWPPKNVVPRRLYLQPHQVLGYVPPSTGAAFSEYLSDPAKPVPYQAAIHWERTREYMLDDQRFAARRPDVLVFETDVLPEDVTLAGGITALLQASLSTSDADFVVKLIDVYPHDSTQAPKQFRPNPLTQPKADMTGYQQLVRGEVLRGRFRNSWERPEAFVPGQVTPVQVRLPDVLHTFKKGHRIMVQVQSSWFPLVDRNPQQFVDTYSCKEEDYIKSTVRIHHSSTQVSYIELPVLK